MGTSGRHAFFFDLAEKRSTARVLTGLLGSVCTAAMHRGSARRVVVYFNSGPHPLTSTDTSSFHGVADRQQPYGIANLQASAQKEPFGCGSKMISA